MNTKHFFCHSELCMKPIHKYSKSICIWYIKTFIHGNERRPKFRSSVSVCLSVSLCCGSVTRQRQVQQYAWLMHAKMTLCACRQNYTDIKYQQLRPNIFSRTCYLGMTSNILPFSHHTKFPTQYIQLKKIWCSIGAFFWLYDSLFPTWFWKLSYWECLLG